LSAANLTHVFIDLCLGMTAFSFTMIGANRPFIDD
jgi:hypothetical protein